MSDLGSRLRRLRIERRGSSDVVEPTPEWVQVESGPLAGRSLLLSRHAAVWQAMVAGEFETAVYDALASSCGDVNGKTVWDVGAHMGYHTLALAELVGSAGRVVAFEPNPSNIERIEQNLARNEDLRERVVVIPRALSNVPGEAVFRQAPWVDVGESSGSHLAEAVVPAGEAAYERFSDVLVETVTADELVRFQGVPSPVFIKVDVEGAELLVLDGSRYLMREARPVFFVEVHHPATMLKLRELADAEGYRVELIDETPRTCQAFVVASSKREAQEGTP
jgi:FkbM family methyltransferase